MFLKLVALLIYCISLYLLKTIINLYQYTDLFFTQDLQEHVYDYIIGNNQASCMFVKYYPNLQILVGAGSAGSLVAHRLSTNQNVTILLLEAGPLGGALLDVPLSGPALQLSNVDWQYKTTPQKNACLGLEEQVQQIERKS